MRALWSWGDETASGGACPAAGSGCGAASSSGARKTRLKLILRSGGAAHPTSKRLIVTAAGRMSGHSKGTRDPPELGGRRRANVGWAAPLPAGELGEHA